ncbi:hypothetical protein M413DRAFT_276319 [Hebeloma cylindrosporum]|uniref:Uncharacterized protein n=1 Tax=Hebeloma cylindrosporum TaxID=76867 RepID=A0A0C3BKM8_HEBCY|nr:hypothetical protein M413DRAFT_276319 [Hebeloma cylindrosporum h7]
MHVIHAQRRHNATNVSVLIRGVTKGSVRSSALFMILLAALGACEDHYVPCRFPGKIAPPTYINGRDQSKTSNRGGIFRHWDSTVEWLLLRGSEEGLTNGDEIESN